MHPVWSNAAALEEKLRGVTPGEALGKRWTTTRNSLLHSDGRISRGSLHLVYFVEWFAGIWYPTLSFAPSFSPLSARPVNVRPFVSTPIFPPLLYPCSSSLLLFRRWPCGWHDEICKGMCPRGENILYVFADGRHSSAGK